MNARAILINVLVIIVIVGGGGAALYYYNQAENYVKTNNAQVTGQAVTLTAPVAGRLEDWSGQVGTTYRSGDIVGHISNGTYQVSIAFPADATIVQQSALPRSFESPGVTLARAYDFTRLWVTANINETDISSIKKGQQADAYIDAFPGYSLAGTIDQIGLATASTFSLLPVSNANANYTKVTQIIPVVVKLDGYKGLNIIPGMSASVRVHI